MKKSLRNKVTIAAALIVIACLVYYLVGRDGGVAINEVTIATYHQEISASQSPALVIFCSRELWTRKSSTFSSNEPSPAILAIKEIIKDGKYKGKIAFWKYTVPDGSYNQATKSFDSDPLCKQLDIKRLPTHFIVRNGEIVWKSESGGCFVKDSKEKIEQALKISLQ